MAKKDGEETSVEEEESDVEMGSEGEEEGEEESDEELDEMMRPSEKKPRIEVKNNTKKTKIIKKIEKARNSKAKIKSRKWINAKKDRQRK